MPTKLLLILSCVTVLSACGSAPPSPGTSTQSALAATRAHCPDVRRLQAADLHGAWQVELTQAGLSGQLTLRQHPEFDGSLRGELRYGGNIAITSGDVEDGEFTMDESRDGKNLFGFWTGQLVPDSCGSEIRGLWQPLAAPGQPALPESDFVLRRRTGWGAP
jgi:hypothetical protein